MVNPKPRTGAQQSEQKPATPADVAPKPDTAPAAERDTDRDDEAATATLGPVGRDGSPAPADPPVGPATDERLAAAVEQELAAERDGDEPLVGRFRTEGGAEITLPLPLEPAFAGQYRRGELVALDGDTDRRVVAAQRPAPSDDKGLWVAYAVARGMPAQTAEAASKGDLIAHYGD